jgi:hypothetical protein
MFDIGSDRRKQAGRCAVSESRDPAGAISGEG